jgi:sensor domain CHASE-containing protein
MLNIGSLELLVIFVMLLMCAIPLVALIWVIVTLARVRSDQKAILERLDAVERSLPKN